MMLVPRPVNAPVIPVINKFIPGISLIRLINAPGNPSTISRNPTTTSPGLPHQLIKVLVRPIFVSNIFLPADLIGPIKPFSKKSPIALNLPGGTAVSTFVNHFETTLATGFFVWSAASCTLDAQFTIQLVAFLPTGITPTPAVAALAIPVATLL